jgi:hypothetical protein
VLWAGLFALSCGSPDEVPLLPRVVSSGGSVLRTPAVVPIVFRDDPAAHDMTQFVEQLARSGYWQFATAEYGVGNLTAKPAIVIDEAPPDLASHKDAEGWIRAHLATPSVLPPPADGTLFALFLPSPRLGAMGFHDDFALSDGTPVTYAVVRTDLVTDDSTSTASHELAEAATDPRPSSAPAFKDIDALHAGWKLLGTLEYLEEGGGEIGDLCQVLPDLSPTPTSSILYPGIDHRVQRVWSNRAAEAFHDPCVPAGLSPYFNAVPRIGELVGATDGNGNRIVTLGLHMAVGESRTVDVDLLSDSPTGPWNVSVADRTLDYPPMTCAVISGAGLLTPDPGPAPGSGSDASAGQTPPPPPPSTNPGCSWVDPRALMAFGKASGKSGDRLKLTITLQASSTSGTHLLLLSSVMGDVETVWPLVVVE